MHAVDLRTTAASKDCIDKQICVFSSFAKDTHLKPNTSSLVIEKISQLKKSPDPESLDIADVQVSITPAAN